MNELDRVTNEYFEALPKDERGWPECFTVLPSGQILLWPALDTAQVAIQIALT